MGRSSGYASDKSSGGGGGSGKGRMFSISHKIRGQLSSIGVGGEDKMRPRYIIVDVTDTGAGIEQVQSKLKTRCNSNCSQYMYIQQSLPVKRVESQLIYFDGVRNF
jgi:hypothetical protein